MRIAALVAVWVGIGLGGQALAGASTTWPEYLDYAYVYSSADSEQLSARLDEYSASTGRSLDDFLGQEFEARAEAEGELLEAMHRRKAVGYLLLYLAEGEPKALDRAVDAVDELKDRLGRHENRYWYHYILAHHALEKGRHHDFTGELLDLWFNVVVPLETPYETLQTLSLNDMPNSGFASALPYLYENIARLVLIRSQEMGMNRGLDPLGSVVRLLNDNRIGAYPEIIPVSASSKEYLDRIIGRLEGPESDAGSLTFTLALFEAAKVHENARFQLAREGLSEDTVKLIRNASRAYQTAYDRADTDQGHCAVYTRVLRQIGEVYAAKQRLDVDPEIETPFTIEGAIEVYEVLHDTPDDRWFKLGYAEHGRDAHAEAMRGLWEEIQEATLNVADYYLSEATQNQRQADEHARNAVRLYTRYLGFFNAYAIGEGEAGVPESAYFAAHEAAKGVGDAFMLYAQHPTMTEVALASNRYQSALRLFPFDREVWSSLTAALERQGRESEYMEIARPAAEGVIRSRAVDAWVSHQEPEAGRIATLGRAFSDSQALMYLGFADAADLETLDAKLEELRVVRDATEETLTVLLAKRDGRAPVAARDSGAGEEGASFDVPASFAEGEALSVLELTELNREISDTSATLDRLNKQLEARARTLPLYRKTLESDGLADELRARRDHPVHTLLRRMYHENRD